MPRACRKCGVMEVGGVRFEKCGKCKGVAAAVVAYYCSRECQIADWPTHARWHADHDRMSAGIAVGAAMPGIGVPFRALQAAVRLKAAIAPKEAARLGSDELERLDPHSGDAPLRPASARTASDADGQSNAAPPTEDVDAATMGSLAADEFKHDPRLWPMAAVVLEAWRLSSPMGSQFERCHPCRKMFCNKECCAALPEWMRDGYAMKTMAESIDKALPDRAEAKAMQGWALGAMGDAEGSGRAFIQAARRYRNYDAARQAAEGRVPIESYLRGARAAFAFAEFTQQGLCGPSLEGERVPRLPVTVAAVTRELLAPDDDSADEPRVGGDADHTEQTSHSAIVPLQPSL